MAGRWRLRLEIADATETMWADFAIEAAADEDGPGTAGRYTLELQEPVRATLFSPAWVVMMAVGLTVAAEGTAVALAMTRRRRSRHPAPDLAGTPARAVND